MRDARSFPTLRQLGEALRRCFQPRTRSGTRVLVVRGSRMAAEMARILKRHGLTAELVDRTAVLDCARRTGPALIVRDLAVSGMSEMEDAIGLRQLLPACKVLLFSGQGLRCCTLPRESEPELVRTIERLCSDPDSGHMLWLDLARFLQVLPRHKSMAA